MKRFNFSYDADADDLFLFLPRSKSKGSIELGDIVFDLNTQKDLVGIQMINASRILKDFVDITPAKIKNILSNLQACEISIRKQNRLMIIRINLTSRDEEIRPILSVPNIAESSPALAKT